MHADLFAGEGSFTPRPAWQVIEAARRQVLTGELSLATTPTTHVYLRDGQIYFAERSTDGGLGVRLLVEGVITRQQMGKGALLVSGVEHLGRMFQRDPSIDRQSVELCVELMTDDVLTAMANDVVDHYTMTMYKRHPNGIDRWLPTRIEVITHVLDAAHLAEPDAVIADGDAPRQRVDVVTQAANGQVHHGRPVNGSPVNGSPVNGSPVTVAALPDTHDEPAAQPPATAADVTAELPVIAEPPMADVAAVEQPAVEAPVVEAPVVETATFDAPIPQAPVVEAATFETHPEAAVTVGLASGSIGSDLAAAAAAGGLLHSLVPETAESLFADPPPPTDSGISLAQSAVDAIMSTAIADEVAEAVRRALAAIDATMTPGDLGAPAMGGTPSKA